MLPLFVLLLLPSLPLVTCVDDATAQLLMTLVQQQTATIQTLQARVTSLEDGAQQHTGQINAINSRLNTQVFFTAHMGDLQHPVDLGTSNTPMKFDVVINNVGNGYNPQTGVFTAPVTGTYVMYAQIMKEINQGSVHYVIDKSGTILCFNGVDTSDYDKSSCLASVHMQKGETVIVRRYEGGQRLIGYWYCAFSGFLLSADAN